MTQPNIKGAIRPGTVARRQVSTALTTFTLGMLWTASSTARRALAMTASTRN